MGPPPFGGGKRRRQVRLTFSLAQLQWGRRLSAVESVWVPANSSNNESLQWGRRLSAVERWRVGVGRLIGQRASMGPPPFGGGKHRTVAAPLVAGGASMGPPPFGGGKPDRRACVGEQEIALQWGRRLSAVESLPASGWATGQLPCFNGAAAFRRWKVQLQGQGMNTEWASMGPPPFGGGKQDRRRAGVAGCSCFNGAAAFRRWKVLQEAV